MPSGMNLTSVRWRVRLPRTILIPTGYLYADRLSLVRQPDIQMYWAGHPASARVQFERRPLKSLFQEAVLPCTAQNAGTPWAFL